MATTTTSIHTRARSSTLSGPHSLTLKVLRLSRPTLAPQTVLPPSRQIPPSASLAYPSASHSSFPLTPLLTLPAAFGAAYVGEKFACTLCCNNELRAGEDRKSVSGVSVVAELQTPSTADGEGIKLDLVGEESGEDGMPPGATLQRTLQHELKEEGPHVLAVTVTYTETLMGREGAASGGRTRTFRKLYQFVAQQLLAVRSKVTERKGGAGWVLEAQLENVGETAVVLEKVKLREREGVVSRGVNGVEQGVVLKPADIEQVMFLLEEKEQHDSDEANSRVPLGQLHIDWRSAMGEQGSLTTGWLSSRGR